MKRKRKLILTSLLCSTVFLFSCGTDDDDDNDYYNGYGNDYYDGYSGLHYQGQMCSTCHGLNSTNEYKFTLGGTVFKILNAQDGDVNNAAPYHTVRLILENDPNNPIVAKIGYGTGNFWLNVNIPEDAKYKVEVLDSNKNVVNYTNGFTHSGKRLDCNRCHTANGENNAPGRIVNYEFYANTGTNPDMNITTLTFTNDILPILEQYCSSCHNENNASGGLNVRDYNSVKSRVDTANPENSLLLQKGAGLVQHGGGTVIGVNSTEYQKILTWIQQGANQ